MTKNLKLILNFIGEKMKNMLKNNFNRPVKRYKIKVIATKKRMEQLLMTALNYLNSLKY